MPCLVNEVRIAGDAEDLAAELLELRVLLLQIRKLRRAHEREVRRIEEEHAPLALEVCLRVLLELTLRRAFLLLERVYLKIADFLIDLRH